MSQKSKISWRNFSYINIIVLTKTNLGRCPRCGHRFNGGNLVYKYGKYGTFIGCSNYPKCRFTKNISRKKK